MLNRYKTINASGHKLYIVGTPIGNLDDMTMRAINTLKNADIIYCEDTRVTGMLLKHFEIDKPLFSYNVNTENEKTAGLIERIKNGQTVALVSDAGMPCISDPGYLAVRQAREEGIDVEVIPGVSAFTTALCGSGISSRTFYFAGFLNSKETKRIEELKALVDKEETVIIYEAPHRIKDTLNNISQIFKDRKICLARELTKKYEEYISGSASDILEIVDEIKGEMVLVIEGAKIKDEISLLNNLPIKEHYNFYVSLGMDQKSSLKSVAKDRGIAKSIVYQEILGKNKNN